MKTIILATMLLVSGATFAGTPKLQSSPQSVGANCKSTNLAENKICRAKHLKKTAVKQNHQAGKVITNESKPKS